MVLREGPCPLPNVTPIQLALTFQIDPLAVLRWPIAFRRDVITYLNAKVGADKQMERIEQIKSGRS